MRPRCFEYHSPSTLAEAFSLFAQWPDESMYFAGGTEAMIVLKERLISYEHLINLKGIEELKQVKLQGDQLTIGSLVTHHELSNHSLIQEYLPGYARLSENIANIRVREAGTLGGNLCFGEPHADPPALLAALGATVRLSTKECARELPLADFLLEEYVTDLNDGEILLSVAVPLSRGPRNAWYQKFVHSYRPAAGVAAACDARDDSVDWQVWAGSLTGRPEKLNTVVKLLNSEPDVPASKIRTAALVDLQALDVPDGNYGSGDYRKHLSSVLASRVVEECRR